MGKKFLCALICLLCLTGCARVPENRLPECQVVLEQGEGFTAGDYLCRGAPREDMVFSLRAKEGYTITGTDWPGAELIPQAGGVVELRLKEVRYTKTVSVFAEKSGVSLLYDPNYPGGATVEVPVIPSHRRWNTARAGLFTREGYTLVGWNTAADGSGTAVGLGSRIEAERGMTLYAQWEPWSPETDFRWEPQGDGVQITAWLGSMETVCVPETLDGRKVIAIGPGAFKNGACWQVILPATLRRIEDGAFSGSQLRDLTIFDTLTTVSDYAFSDCEEFQTLHINAARGPVYSGTYYATFADKMDRLKALAGERKIVLFSGSSARFGYDSAAIDRAFPDYQVVNMGVFAYTNALPQIELIARYLQKGDVFLHSPELDAAKRQFCTTNDLDAAFFMLAEADYDLVSLLDLRHYGQVFTAFQAYQAGRAGMPERSYDLSPGDFDEDGNPVSTPSYNEYGDYILYRPNSAGDVPIYGLPVKYTVAAYPKDFYLDPLNRVTEGLQALGVRVYITYSPRNALAVSQDSTPEAIQALDDYFRANLTAPVISRLADSLVSGVYLYGTDNHLSTEGVALRTEQVIRALLAQLEKEGAL